MNLSNYIGTVNKDYYIIKITYNIDVKVVDHNGNWLVESKQNEI